MMMIYNDFNVEHPPIHSFLILDDVVKSCFFIYCYIFITKTNRKWFFSQNFNPIISWMMFANLNIIFANMLFFYNLVLLNYILYPGFWMEPLVGKIVFVI